MNLVKSYSYYKNLGFDNFESWSEGDLSQFLIGDFLNVFGSTIIGKDIPESFARDNKLFVGKYKKYLFVFPIIDKLFQLFQKLISFFTRRSGEKIFLFQNLRSNFIMTELKKDYYVNFIAQGKQDRLFAVENFINYIGITELYQYVDDYFKDKDVKHLYKLIEKAEYKLRNIKPDYIVLAVDSRPVERAIILAARKMSIPTLVVQDGLQDLHLPLFDCTAADYVLVWGKHFKDLYTNNNIRRPEDIYILGYPYSIEKNAGSNDKRHCSQLTVCYLAQGYERYNKDFLKIKLETIESLSNICKKLGLEFVCRPHPTDDRVMLIEKLPHVHFTPEKEKPEGTFKSADIFISFSSTSLIEAAMRSKISLQLMNYPFKPDNFEELKICNKSFETIGELENYLAKIVDAADLKGFKLEFNNDYIETRYDPSQRFLEIIKEIEKK